MIPGRCLHRLGSWAWPSLCYWPHQVGWRSPSSQNIHETSSKWSMVGPKGSVTAVPTRLSTLPPIHVSNAGGQLLVLWEMLDCKALGLCQPARRRQKSGTSVWFSYVLRHVGGGERAVRRYLKQSGLKMDSIVLLLSVLISLWICKYRTLSKKCQISLA